MKKLITILVILIVVVGAVFAADENKSAATGAAQLDVTCHIDATAPRFALASDDTTNLQAEITTAVVNGKTKDDISVGATGALAATVATSLGNGTAATVSFKINQTQTSRIKAIYDLTITATDMQLTAYSDGTAKTSGWNANESFECTTKTPAVSAPNATATANNVTVAAFSGSSNVLTADYKGGVVAVAANNVLTIGTFDVVWSGNATAVAGDYKASIIMEVVAR